MFIKKINLTLLFLSALLINSQLVSGPVLSKPKEKVLNRKDLYYINGKMSNSVYFKKNNLQRYGTIFPNGIANIIKNYVCNLTIIECYNDENKGGLFGRTLMKNQLKIFFPSPQKSGHNKTSQMYFYKKNNIISYKQDNLFKIKNFCYVKKSDGCDWYNSGLKDNDLFALDITRNLDTNIFATVSTNKKNDEFILEGKTSNSKEFNNFVISTSSKNKGNFSYFYNPDSENIPFHATVVTKKDENAPPLAQVLVIKSDNGQNRIFVDKYSFNAINKHPFRLLVLAQHSNACSKITETSSHYHEKKSNILKQCRKNANAVSSLLAITTHS